MNAIIATAHVPVCEQHRYDTAHAGRLRHSRPCNLEDEWALIAASYPSEADDLYLNFRTVHAYRKNDFTNTIASYNMYVRIGDLKMPKGREKVLRWRQRNVGKHYNLYFARNPVLNKKHNSASRTWEVALITSFALDLDGVHPDMALKIVRQAGYPDPSMIIKSGIRGAHVYWFLAVPLANTTEAQAVLKKFVVKSKRRIQASDARVKDSIRILRAPGGRNFKSMESEDSPVPSEPAYGNRIIYYTGAKYLVTDLLDASPDLTTLLAQQYEEVLASIDEMRNKQKDVLSWVKEGREPGGWRSENAIPPSVKTLDGAVQYMNDTESDRRFQALDESEERWIEPEPPARSHLSLIGLPEQESLDSCREIDIGFIDSVVPRLTEKETRHHTLPEVVQAILRSYPEHDRTKRLLRGFHHRFFVLNREFISSSEEESFADFMNCWNLADPSKVGGGFLFRVRENMVRYELAHEILQGERYAKHRLLADFLYTACRMKDFSPRNTWLAYKDMAQILGYRNKESAHKAMQVVLRAKKDGEKARLFVLVQKGGVRGGKPRGSLWAVPERNRNPEDRCDKDKRAA